MPEPSALSTTASGDPPLVRWGWLFAVAGWVIGLVGGTIASAVVLAVSDTAADDYEDLSLGWIAVAQVGLWLGLLGVPLVVSHLVGRGAVRDYVLRFRGSDVPRGAVAGLVSQLVLIPLVYIPIFWLTDKTADDMAEPARGLTDQATDPVGVLLLVLIVGIGAPIVEEIFYRGLLQRSLVHHLGTWPGVLVASLLFGVAHFQLLQLPALVLFGIVLGVLTVRTGRLGPAIVAHLAFNMVTVIVLVAQ